MLCIEHIVSDVPRKFRPTPMGYWSLFFLVDAGRAVYKMFGMHGKLDKQIADDKDRVAKAEASNGEQN